MAFNTVEVTYKSTIDNSGSLTSAGVAEDIFAHNARRAFLLIQNLDSSHSMWINFGDDAQERGAGSINLQPFETFTFESGVMTPERISALGTVDGQKYTAKQIEFNT